MLTTKSVLVPTDLLPSQEISLLIKNHIEATEVRARKDLPTARLVTRDLMPSDVGLSSEIWYETTGSSRNTWEDSDIASKSIADDTYVCIWGVTILSEDPAVSAIRIVVGDARKAQWTLDKILEHQVKVGIALSPVIISRNMTITVQHYVKVASAGFEMSLDGIVVEKEAITLNP
jgi:hypothetical protein